MVADSLISSYPKRPLGRSNGPVGYQQSMAEGICWTSNFWAWTVGVMDGENSDNENDEMASSLVANAQQTILATPHGAKCHLPS